MATTFCESTQIRIPIRFDDVFAHLPRRVAAPEPATIEEKGCPVAVTHPGQRPVSAAKASQPTDHVILHDFEEYLVSGPRCSLLHTKVTRHENVIEKIPGYYITNESKAFCSSFCLSPDQLMLLVSVCHLFIHLKFIVSIMKKQTTSYYDVWN